MHCCSSSPSSGDIPCGHVSHNLSRTTMCILFLLATACIRCDRCVSVEVDVKLSDLFWTPTHISIIRVTWYNFCPKFFLLIANLSTAVEGNKCKKAYCFCSFSKHSKRIVVTIPPACARGRTIGYNLLEQKRIPILYYWTTVWLRVMIKQPTPSV